MALSMDEQRILAEIERRLAADDPGLASSLSTFRRPGPGSVLRSPRARIIGSLFTVLLVALVSLMVYAMIPFRDHTMRNAVTPPPAQASGNSASASAGGSHPPSIQQATISATTSGTSTVASAPNGSTDRSAGAAAPRAQATHAKTTGASAAPATKP
jgi:Protein of unknown function (DUF3040)